MSTNDKNNELGFITDSKPIESYSFYNKDFENLFLFDKKQEDDFLSGLKDSIKKTHPNSFYQHFIIIEDLITFAGDDIVKTFSLILIRSDFKYYIQTFHIGICTLHKKLTCSSSMLFQDPKKDSLVNNFKTFISVRDF